MNTNISIENPIGKYGKNNNSLAERFSLTTYLTTQLQEIICMGPGHLLTWANNRTHQTLPALTQRGQAYDWMQVSVQSGTECHLMVQFILPAVFGDAVRPQLDHIFAQYGWTNEQSDGRECLVYYVAQSASSQRLLAEAESVAIRCAAVMRRLWQADSLDDIALLGVRGPRCAPKTRVIEQKPALPLSLPVRARVA